MGLRRYREMYRERPYIVMWVRNEGRYTKRQLSKARRLKWKRELAGLHLRGAWHGWETSANWKNW